MMPCVIHHDLKLVDTRKRLVLSDLRPQGVCNDASYMLLILLKTLKNRRKGAVYRRN
jgi:hypothetical protein